MPPAASLATPAHSLLVRTTNNRRRPAANPLAMVTGFVQHRHLIAQMTRREVLGRYKGSYLGLLWPFLNPIVLLVIYTVVFKYIFNTKFSGRFGESGAEFSLILFSGLIVFNVFAECIARAPNLILLNSNYVNRVVFPLEILPVTIVLSGAFHLLMSFVPLLLATFFLTGTLPGTMLQWPLLLLPVIGYGLGATWLIAATGVFLRDLNEIALAAIQVLMYASAIFYPLRLVSDKVPPLLQPFVQWNPVANLVEQSRLTAAMGEPLDWHVYGILLAGGIVCMGIGFAVFMRVKHTFADVI